jgi:hypothetical protein
MKRKGKQEHMSLGLVKGDILPPLQKKIVLHLAKSEPKTINETVTALKGNYKSSWIAFNKLEEKQIIQKTDTKSYRGREYPRFWLTPTGVLIALFEGINFEVLLERTLKMYPDDKNIQILLELSPVFGTEVFKLAFLTILKKGKLDEDDLTMIVTAELNSPEAQSDFGGRRPEDILAILKKHPVAYENTKKYARRAREKIEKLDSLFK